MRGRVEVSTVLKFDNVTKYNHPTAANKIEYDENLYNYMEKYIDNGTERFFAQCGSKKVFPYEILEIIFHENAHVFQKEYNRIANILCD